MTKKITSKLRKSISDMKVRMVKIKLNVCLKLNPLKMQMNYKDKILALALGYNHWN